MRVSIAGSCVCSRGTDSSQGCRPAALDVDEVLGSVSASFSCNFIQMDICLRMYNSSCILTETGHPVEKCIILYSSRDFPRQSR